MKYDWQDRPPDNKPPLSKTKLWPKPDYKTAKYAWAKGACGFVLAAIAQIAAGNAKGRWEIYLLGWQIIGEPPKSKIIQKWRPQSRLHKLGYRVGYSKYENAYRSIPQHIRKMR